jgi:uncharacterized membrane protein HdeD (DUF308 family)
MKKVIGIVLLAGGVVLLVLGFQEKDSLQSRVSNVLEGSPGKKATWQLVGGTACAVAGAAVILMSSKSK